MLCNETIVTFAEAAARLPRVNGRRAHTSTVWRWSRKGVKGVRLECRRLGGRFVTSLEALDRFGKALAEIEPPEQPAPSTSKHPTDRQRERAVAEAKATLRDAGIL